MAAMPILKSRCCWRVGDGLTIRVHSDRWIPNHPAHRLLSPANDDKDDCMVSDLIDLDLNCWQREFIRTKFCREDAGAI